MNLKDEIVAGESYSLEFKRVPNEERGKYLKTVVAFANGKGGRILFGVANDRTVVGIPNERICAEMDGIVNSISDVCAPKIPVDLGVENIDGRAVIVLDVLAGVHCPYYLKDGVFVRGGATTCVADDATRRELAFLSNSRGHEADFIFAALAHCFAKISAARRQQATSRASTSRHRRRGGRPLRRSGTSRPGQTPSPARTPRPRTPRPPRSARRHGSGCPSRHTP